MGNLVAGIFQNKASKQQAAQLREQGEIVRAETKEEAQRKATELRKFKKTQQLSFLKSGVRTIGTPALVLHQTLLDSQKEVDAVARRGTAQQNLLEQKATATRNQGRAALISGAVSDLSEIGKRAATAMAAGAAAPGAAGSTGPPAPALPGP